MRVRMVWWAPAILFAALVIVAAGCRSDAGDALELPTAEVLTATALPTEVPATAVPTEVPTPRPTNTPTPTPTPSPTDLALEAWSQYWAIALSPDGEEPAGSMLADFIEADAVDLIDNATDEPFAIDNYTRVDVRNDAEIFLSDCVIVYDPNDPEADPLYGQTANYMLGTVANDGTGWTMTAILQQGPCVPIEIADEVIAHYEEFWDAVPIIWDPPDPNHPLLEQTMTGTYLESRKDLLADLQAKGWYREGARPTTHPEVYRVDAHNIVVLTDCQEANTERGLFDSNGERQEDIPIPEPGETDGIQTTLVRDDPSGRWRVADTGGLRNIDCKFAPTDRGLPQL